MELTKFEIRVVLEHYWKQDYKTAAAARRICEVQGQGVVSEHVARNNREENTEDLPHSGRPKLWVIENIEFWKEICKKKKCTGRLSDELCAAKILYIARLRHLENHIETVELNLIN